MWAVISILFYALWDGCMKGCCFLNVACILVHSSKNATTWLPVWIKQRFKRQKGALWLVLEKSRIRSGQHTYTVLSVILSKIKLWSYVCTYVLGERLSIVLSFTLSSTYPHLKKVFISKKFEWGVCKDAQSACPFRYLSMSLLICNWNRWKRSTAFAAFSLFLLPS